MASWGLEALLRPCPVVPWRRPLSALCVHAGTWTLTFALALALFRRPIFAAASALALQYVLVIVNDAKYRSLGEPFVYPDFIFFTDTLKHPRLYLPFLGWLPPLVAATGYGLALWAGLRFEPAVDADTPTWTFFVYVAAFAAFGLALALIAARRLPRSAAFDAARDLQQLGLIAALWQYAAAERADTQAIRAAAPFAKMTQYVLKPLPSPSSLLPHAGKGSLYQQAPPAIPFPANGKGHPAGTGKGQPPAMTQRHAIALPAPAQTLPDLLVIQSESFFDPRRIYPQIRPEVLTHYDALRADALQHGQLLVDAWGANTIRTEFAFLSGLAPEALGVHRFHPYRTLARQDVATLASYVRSLGYRSICVHPYHGSFYDRDKVLPMLGFDNFIDLRAFRGAKRAGPYVSDLALAEHVQAILEHNSNQPLYIHVITMENHGPLHWERVTEHDAQAVLSGPIPQGCDDLVAYVRHLRNADAMFGRLRQCLSNRARPGVLCLFGDHVPIMPKIYRQLGAPDGATDYLVWRSDRRPDAARDPVTIRINNLAKAILEQTGIRRTAQELRYNSGSW